MTHGEDAERLVHERLRDALPPVYRFHPNVAWTGSMRDHGPAEDGEADLVIAHPDHGILVLEVKSGEPSRDDGTSKGLPHEDVADEPSDCVVFESIRRYKGLEREVVVLVELPESAERFDELLYVGLTRATTQLLVIAPPLLAARLR